MTNFKSVEKITSNCTLKMSQIKIQKNKQKKNKKKNKKKKQTENNKKTELPSTLSNLQDIRPDRVQLFSSIYHLHCPGLRQSPL